MAKAKAEIESGIVWVDKGNGRGYQDFGLEPSSCLDNTWVNKDGSINKDLNGKSFHEVCEYYGWEHWFFATKNTARAVFLFLFIFNYFIN